MRSEDSDICYACHYKLSNIKLFKSIRLTGAAHASLKSMIFNTGNSLYTLF